MNEETVVPRKLVCARSSKPLEEVRCIPIQEGREIGECEHPAQPAKVASVCSRQRTDTPDPIDVRAKLDLMLSGLPADVIKELTAPLRPTLRLIQVASDVRHAGNIYSGSDRIINDVSAGGRCVLVAKFVQCMSRDDPRIRADVRARVSLEIVGISSVVI